MCGIVGFVGRWGESLLSAMVAALGHRGPDGSAALYEANGSVGLGHTRLAIIDLSQNAAQPMESACGRYVITYNGELYNYRELRRELEGLGIGFRSQSDTEVLLQSFVHWGLSCLARFVGIFAFAVWDRERRQLLLARDQLGVKPLYYAALPGGLLFSSEIKVLTLCADLPRIIDATAVAGHLGFIWTGGEETVLRSVRKLRPGHYLSLDANGLRVERYYRSDLPSPQTLRSGAEPAELRHLIDRIVADQMVADVSVGALLSGGLDSSTVVASMCRATEPGRITAFCAAVPKDRGRGDNFGDDAAYARQFADELGVNLIEVPTEANIVDALPEMIWALDEPTPDFSALQLRMLAAAARARGIKVLLSGAGGDDLFTGYGRHTAAVLYARFGAVPGLRAIAGRLFACAPATSHFARRLRRLGQLFDMGEDEMLAESMSYSELAGRDRLALFAPEVRRQLPSDGIPAAMRARLAESRGQHPVTRMLDLDIGGFVPDLNLNYADKMAMQEGIEIRVPLLDPRLVAYAMSLPVHDKIALRTTKKLLRGSQVGRLPPSILRRPKQGFGVPIRAWLAGPARALMEELTAPSVIEARGLFDPRAVANLKRDFLTQRRDLAFTLFAMMAIEAWCRRLDLAPHMALADTGTARLASQAG
jgi:asparagine synthase (glutamine-hydrolysing)